MENTNNQVNTDWVKEFERCKPWIESALEYSLDTHDIQDIQNDLVNNKLQLWPGEKSVIVTQILEYPKKRVMHVFLAGGDIKDIESRTDGITAWAKLIGCNTITLTGRPGWVKSFLKNKGYKTTQVYLSKEI